MADSKAIVNNGFIALRDKSEIFAKRQLINLDNSLITVKTGALIDLTGGSTVTVGSAGNLRDLIRLTNNSKITVVNGPLIRVDGNGTRLDVNRGLVLFSAGANNKIVVKNDISSTRTINTGDGGFRVNEATGGSVAIGNNPIRGGGGGTITVTKTDGTAGGVLIQATNNGVVDIKAP